MVGERLHGEPQGTGLLEIGRVSVDSWSRAQVELWEPRHQGTEILGVCISHFSVAVTKHNQDNLWKKEFFVGPEPTMAEAMAARGRNRKL